ncbi:MAG TPA: ribosome maturation factor RimM [Candidatus Blautia stercoripullorum]|uniref:Ribosome maturation factor RimM n=1 Tax=Candidatus Blautia stercoripullorum TaxID=2838502 RepID=A0A9D2RBV0_9FIRM|nr:ribosome maturation factor RimM [Candidatus Blautia stercoripullorum]
MEDLLQVGVITTTHGIRGEVKVFPTTDDPHRFEVLPSILLDTGKELCELEIQRVKYFKQFVILKFKDVDDINEIEPYKGKSLYVTRDMAVPLKENEYYIGDLIGMEVFLEDGSYFGTLKDVMETGANDVYIVQTEDREVLIPAIKDCILKVDVEDNKMTIHLLKGL